MMLFYFLTMCVMFQNVAALAGYTTYLYTNCQGTGDDVRRDYVASVEGCAEWCDKHADCGGFIRLDNGKCYMRKGPATATGIGSSNGRNCYIKSESGIKITSHICEYHGYNKITEGYRCLQVMEAIQKKSAMPAYDNTHSGPTGCRRDDWMPTGLPQYYLETQPNLNLCTQAKECYCENSQVSEEKKDITVSLLDEEEKCRRVLMDYLYGTEDESTGPEKCDCYTEHLGADKMSQYGLNKYCIVGCDNCADGCIYEGECYPRMTFDANVFACIVGKGQWCSSTDNGEPYELLKEDVECGDNNHESNLGWDFDTVDECAEACRQKNGCTNFIYGKNEKAGHCWDEGITEEACTQWDNKPYDFYKLNNVEVGTMSFMALDNPMVALFGILGFSVVAYAAFKKILPKKEYDIIL